MLPKDLDSRLIASLATVAITGSTTAAFADSITVQGAYHETVPTITQRINQGELLLAHHEGASSSLGAVDILGTETPGGPGEALSNSLWGNLILQMAYGRDKQVARSAKKLKLTDNLTLASIYGISGVSLAQSITGLVTLNAGGHGGALRLRQPEGNHPKLEDMPKLAVTVKVATVMRLEF